LGICFSLKLIYSLNKQNKNENKSSKSNKTALKCLPKKYQTNRSALWTNHLNRYDSNMNNETFFVQIVNNKDAFIIKTKSSTQTTTTTRHPLRASLSSWSMKIKNTKKKENIEFI
jgi:hypothetical protein